MSRVVATILLVVVFAPVTGAEDPAETVTTMKDVASAESLLASYDLSWWTVDSGGGLSTGGDLELTATVGQPDAGVVSGSDYVLSGGLWSGGTVDPSGIFSDNFESGDTSAWSAVVGATP